MSRAQLSLREKVTIAEQKPITKKRLIPSRPRTCKGTTKKLGPMREGVNMDKQVALAKSMGPNRH
jgi:hypothetical protein